MSVLAENARTGKLGNPFIAFEEIERAEENVAKLEQKLQLLINESAVLRESPEEVERIQERILRTKERVFIAKEAAAIGVLQAESPESTFLRLKELKGG